MTPHDVAEHTQYTRPLTTHAQRTHNARARMCTHTQRIHNESCHPGHTRGMYHAPETGARARHDRGCAQTVGYIVRNTPEQGFSATVLVVGGFVGRFQRDRSCEFPVEAFESQRLPSACWSTVGFCGFVDTRTPCSVYRTRTGKRVRTGICL